jgi:hypothetical protein
LTISLGERRGRNSARVELHAAPGLPAMNAREQLTGFAERAYVHPDRLTDQRIRFRFLLGGGAQQGATQIQT